MKTFEDMQKVGKDSADAALKSLGAVTKSAQAIAVELADYSKRAFEDGAAATEKLFHAKSLEKAVEVQSDYVKAACGIAAEAICRELSAMRPDPCLIAAGRRSGRHGFVVDPRSHLEPNAGDPYDSVYPLELPRRHVDKP